MHVSYLNADYDSRVLDKWRETVWTGKDAFYGCDGFHYIKAHLGYRYLIDSFQIQKTGLFKPCLTLTLTLRNNGFSNTLKPFQTSFLLKNTKTGETTRLPLQADLRSLGSGEKKLSR